MAKGKTKATKRTRRKAGEPLVGQVSMTRVEAALVTLGIDREAFVQAYDDVRGTRTRTPKAITSTELEAFNAFEESGDFEAFHTSLGVTPGKANSLIARIFRQRASRSRVS
jgi:hypothetical protein